MDSVRQYLTDQRTETLHAERKALESKDTGQDLEVRLHYIDGMRDAFDMVYLYIESLKEETE